jgi:5-methyltetrahydrofolate--homocysteine methyltransferase
MVADVLRGRGHRVVELGGATPVESFLSVAADADDLLAIGVSASTTPSLHAATKLIRRVRSELPGVPVLLGGPAVTTEAVAQKAGADGWAPDAVAAGDALDAVTAR